MRATGMDAKQFTEYLMRVERTFGVTVDYTKLNGEHEKGLHLLDLAMARRAAEKRTPLRDGSPRRVGLPEVTAEWRLVLQRSAALLHNDDLSRLAEKYRDDLERMRNGDDWPQSTEPGEDSGYGYVLALGGRHLSGRAQVDFADTNVNMLLHPWAQRPAVQLPQVTVPALVTEKEARWQKTITDPKDIAAIREAARQFVLEIDALRELKKQDKLTQEKAKRLAELEKNYYDRNDGHEFILVLPDGRLIRYVFIWSQKDQDERIQRFILRAADAELQEHAISTDGAVVFNRIAADGTVGQVIPDKAGHKFRIGMAEADKVLDWIGTLSPQRQTEIFLRKFVSFEYELNGQKVLATLTFPRDVDVTREWTNPWTGVTSINVFRNGLQIESRTDESITEMFYGPDGLEKSTVTYQNASGDRKHPVRGRVVGRTATLKFIYVDLGRRAPTPGNFSRPP